jgi:small-conductance mechanosensitive channel
MAYTIKNPTTTITTPSENLMEEPLEEIVDTPVEEMVLEKTEEIKTELNVGAKKAELEKYIAEAISMVEHYNTQVKIYNEIFTQASVDLQLSKYTIPEIIK